MSAVKICGITDLQALDTAVNCGAAFVGFMFYPPSPRYISADKASGLSEKVPDSVGIAGVFVDPSDGEIESVLELVRLTHIQLHGNESPERARQVRETFKLPVIKAFRIKSVEDLQTVQLYDKAVDWFLFDAAPSGTSLPGGTGKTFDWNILKGKRFAKPWMLSGGLNAENIGKALEILSPDAVDLSSGVEDSPGKKNPAKIQLFFETIHS